MRILLLVLVLGGSVAAADPTKAAIEWKPVAPTRPVRKLAATRDFDPAPTPRPLDAASQRLVDAATLLLALAPDEHGRRLAAVRFLRLDTLRRFDHLDEAMVDMVAILEHARGEEVWTYAANLLLDALIRLERHDELIVWVRRLRADKGLATSDPELASRLRMIEQRWSRTQAETLEQAGDLVACGDAYDQARAIDPGGDRIDEMLFNAGVCFERGAAAERALARYGELIRVHRRSPLVARARVRSAHLRLARFDLGGAARDAGPQLGAVGVVVRPLAAALAPSRLLFRP